MTNAFLSNAHTHSTFCDGRSSLAETIQRAKDLGFVSLGFSGHASQGFDGMYSMIGSRQDAYFDAVSSYQQKESIRIWIGLEMDLMADEEERIRGFQRADYIIGSTHYASIDRQNDRYVAYDGQLDLLTAYVKDHCDGDGMELAKRYYVEHTTRLNAYRPDIIGHFDLVRKHAKTLGFFDENDTAYRRLALDALQSVRACGAVLEVNTGGMARGSMPSPYPTAELLGAWREMGGEVTITSDCHHASKLDYFMDGAMKLLHSLGYKRALRLGTGVSLWEDVTL